jgi:hypothetical protein
VADPRRSGPPDGAASRPAGRRSPWKRRRCSLRGRAPALARVGQLAFHGGDLLLLHLHRGDHHAEVTVDVDASPADCFAGQSSRWGSGRTHARDGAACSGAEARQSVHASWRRIGTGRHAARSRSGPRHIAARLIRGARRTNAAVGKRRAKRGRATAPAFVNAVLRRAASRAAAREGRRVVGCVAACVRRARTVAR